VRPLVVLLALLALAALPVGAVADSWSETGALQASRAEAAATLLPSGQVLAAGGVAGTVIAFSTSTAERYDPAGGAWVATGVLDQGRAGPGLSTLPDGGALLTGGGDFTIGSADVFASTLVFDPTTNGWSAAAPMPNPHYDQTQVTL